MRTITVQVTRADIKQGCRRDPLRCPIARALRRATGIDWNVGSFNAWGNCHLPPAALPEDVQAWIDRFDARKSGKPFAFTLEIP